YRAGQPIPDGIKAQAKARIAAGGYDCTYVDLSRTRVLKASDPLARPLWPGEKGGKAADGSAIPRRVITYYNLLIVSDEFAAGDTCEVIERWAHELTHVHHHTALGWNRFLERYLTQGQAGYERISFEADAVTAEERAFKECATPRDSTEHMTAVGVLHDAEEAWHRVPSAL